MKKLIVIVALLGMVASIALSGCKPAETAPATPPAEAPSTNAPAH